MKEDICVLEEHTSIIDKPPMMTVLYYGTGLSIEAIHMMSENFNMLPLVIKDQAQLIRFLTNESKRISFLSLDIEHCQSLVNTTAYDYVRMLDTVLSLSNNRVPIIGVTKLDTDARFIKEFMKIPEVNGLVIDAAESTEAEMIEALTDMCQKRYHVPKRIKQKIQESQKKKRVVSVSAGEIVLTPRQTQILNLVLSKGASNKVIANILKISESTVKLHITAILKKYGLRNRTQLALFAKTKD